MQFKDIIGQEQTKRHLREIVRNGRISHAVLFTGHEGTGGLPMALAYAQYIYCRDRTDEDSCGQCPECYRMHQMEHPDCHYVYPVNKLDKNKTNDKPHSEQFLPLWRKIIHDTNGYLTEQEWYAQLDIDNKQGVINKTDANELVRKKEFKSFEGGYKTVILWLPERLNDSAANTLLKLIEEPPEKTLFLFVSNDHHKIISTIKSRLQIVALPCIPDPIVANELIARENISAESAGQIARAAQGNWNAALRMTRPKTNNSTNEHEERFINFMRLCYLHNPWKLFDWAEEMASLNLEEKKQFCISAIELIRKCYLTGIGMERIAYTAPTRETFCRNFAPFVSHLTVETYIIEFELLLNQIRQNGNSRIIFTHFALSIWKIFQRNKFISRK